MEDLSVPVLIVGGGLVGLSAAVFLTWQGERPLLVERHSGTSLHPRARGVNVRAMELFRQVGLEDEIRATESAVALADNSGIVRMESLAGFQAPGFNREYLDEDARDVSPTGWTLCEQDELEPVLRAHAEESGADLRFGHELVGHTHDAEGVTATVRHRATGKEYAVRARYVVVADGAASPIREQLGIARQGRGVLARYLNIHFRADLTEALGERRFVMAYVRNAEVTAGLLPINNTDRWLLHVPLDPQADSDQDGWDEERCEAAVRAAAGVPDLPVKILGAQPWQAAGLVAETFRVGRLFLVGDSAHVMPPTGAFGSATGIQDAHNLAWKLAMVLRGKASEALLDSYEAEREPVARATVRQTVLRSLDRPGHGEPIPEGAILPDHVVALGYHYPVRDVAPEDVLARDDGSAAPGTRAPHLWLERDGVRISSLDLYDGRGMVLVAGPEAGDWPEVVSGASLPITVHRIGAHQLTDPSQRWARTHGVPGNGAVLVRPDGFVLDRFTAEDDPQTALTQALSTLLGRRPGTDAAAAASNDVRSHG
ncbi:MULTISPECIES: FAD-dependent oxidoreductase [unclassified Streptomyces]|uniref:FAD-dependent oxidoreductase n=1 Tax=unclassified Streptomyces TaxID=2593676 RepID=UPI002E21A9C7|nr:FAD-dependent monooxygenase [Streptomyces sp. NBC_01023]